MPSLHVHSSCSRILGAPDLFRVVERSIIELFPIAFPAWLAAACYGNLQSLVSGGKGDDVNLEHGITSRKTLTQRVEQSYRAASVFFTILGCCPFSHGLRLKANFQRIYSNGRHLLSAKPVQVSRA